MRLKANRVLLSDTSVFSIINNSGARKLDMSFTNSSNYITMDQLKDEFDAIESRNLPLSRSVLEAVRSKRIIMCATDVSSSITFAYGMDTQKQGIVTVFCNLSRVIKTRNDVNARGEIVQVHEIVGGYTVLYDLLLSAYIGLNAQKVYNSPNCCKILREIYCDVFSQVMSRLFGNPVDGEQFRFLVAYYFYNGEVTGYELAQAMKFNPDKVSAIDVVCPGFLNSAYPISLNDFIDVIRKLFPTLDRNNLTTDKFVFNAISMFGDNAIYCLDNHAYFLSVIVNKCRKSKVFKGYVLKSLERDASTTLSTIFRSVL